MADTKNSAVLSICQDIELLDEFLIRARHRPLLTETLTLLRQELLKEYKSWTGLDWEDNVPVPD